MWVIRASFDLPDTGEETIENVTDAIGWWTSALRHNGQLLGNVFPVYRADCVLHYTLLVPEEDSLSDTHANEWVHKAVSRVQERSGSSPRLTPLGEDMESGEPCPCTNRTSLVLFTNYVAVDPPLRCGDCFGAIPLYRVPAWENDEYHRIKSWESDYQVCDRLQMGCATGERFGLREMGSPGSSLTQRGRELCEHITKATGTPTYYYLFRYRGRGLRSETARCCPVCDGAWLLPEPIFARFHFRCDTCRLLSNIAYGIPGR